MNALSGRFTQQLIDAEGETLQQSEGQFWLQKPGKLNWHTQAPFEQLLITNDENLWLYDPDLQQVTVKNIDKTLEQSPVSILSGNVENFNLHYVIEQKTGADNRDEFVLLPRAQEALFEQLTLTFNDGIIESMQLLDSLGQVTDITLLETQLNPEIDAEQFIFSTPPGTDVLVDD
jgi:outer membrane lipoprotein carrier protein